MPGAGTDLRVRVVDLRRRTGEREQIRRVVGHPTMSVGEVQVGEDPFELDLAAESVPGGVRVEGRVGFSWSGPCRRCLGPARGHETAELEELFVDAPPDGGTGGSAGGGDEVPVVRDGWIDLTEAVHDSVLLGLPLAPLCGQDCPGPAPEDFPVGVGDPPEGASEGADTEGPPPDPRWAALRGLGTTGE